MAASPHGEIPPSATCHLPQLVASEEQQAVTLTSLLSFAPSADLQLKAQFVTQPSEQAANAKRPKGYMLWLKK